MILFKRRSLQKMRRAAVGLVGLVLGLVPMSTFAAAEIVDALDLSAFIPIVLDAMMMVATGGYEFFVGNGDGIIYLFVWGFLIFSLAMYALKMFFPKTWTSFFGFSGGGEMANGINGMKIALDVLKPSFRAIIAAVVLLQIRPVFVTEWLINPFLQFGAIYTNAITQTINQPGITTHDIECPQDIIEKKWISPNGCKFLVQPVADISHANNSVIKRGFQFISNGLRGLITLIPHGGQDFMSLVTGILLVMTFVSCNLFMALLIIQAIFEFGISLALYPFQVLMWVAKPKNPDQWFDVWPAFSGITTALQKIIVTMIACAFILVINIAVIKALFQTSNSEFVVAAGGAASSNVPQIANGAVGFGGHALLWLSSILTFYLMIRIFDTTRKRLDTYVGGGSDTLYKNVMNDSKRTWNNTISLGKTIGQAVGWIKKK